eukprot:5734519-Lingulodinium_polyedra.AAC.1
MGDQTIVCGPRLAPRDLETVDAKTEQLGRGGKRGARGPPATRGIGTLGGRPRHSFSGAFLRHV